MMSKHAAPWVLSLLMALLIGSPSVAQPKKIAGQGSTVRLLDEKILRQLLTQRKGRVLVLNVWATWCQPCVEEFPSLVRLDSTYRNRGVDVVTLSIDFEDEVEGQVQPFLRRMKATMTAYVNAYPTPSDLINAVHKDWSGAIPATFFYDARGTMVAHVIGGRTYEQFRELTEQALGKSSRP